MNRRVIPARLAAQKILRVATVAAVCPTAREFSMSAGNAEDKLKELGLVLPQPSAPKGNYVAVTRVGNMLYTGKVP